VRVNDRDREKWKKIKTAKKERSYFPTKGEIKIQRDEGFDPKKGVGEKKKKNPKGPRHTHPTCDGVERKCRAWL